MTVTGGHPAEGTARGYGGVAPFPFVSLEVLTRADVRAAARLRRVARDHVRLEGIEAALSELVEEPVAIVVRRYRRLEAGSSADDAIGVVLAHAGERATSRRILVEVEGALGAALTARALRQRAPRVTDPARPPSPALVGGLAAVLTSALRRAHAAMPLKVIAAGPASALARDLAATERDVTTVWLSVTMGGEAFHARVSVPGALVVTSPEDRLSRSDLLAMGEASLALPLVIATTLASRADLEGLAPGDAFVPTNVALAPGRDLGVGASLVGPVALIAARAERGLSAALAEDGQLVVRDRLESHPWEREMPLDERASDSPATVMEALEDAPVVVRVELGTVEMKAREWAALGPGDVVTLGRRLGDPAILRVGGVELARGELVQVEGEYAVRIVARAKAAAGDIR